MWLFDMPAMQRRNTPQWPYVHRTRALLYADDNATIRVVMAIGNSNASYCYLYDAGMAHDDLEAFYRLTRHKASIP
jgi:hypothetical protein